MTVQTIEKGRFSRLVRETLSDRSYVYNVCVEVETDLEEFNAGVEFYCVDEAAAQELFAAIEKCSGVAEG